MDFIITSEFHNVRLDRFVRKKYREIPLTGIFRLIRKGQIRVNGSKQKPAYRLQENDSVSVNIHTPPSAVKPLVKLSRTEQQQVAGAVVYEDADIVLCNKPPGLVMHRGSGHEYGFVEMVRSVTKNPQFTFVNRIDRATAGLVIGAKNPAAVRKLAELFRQQAIEKYYLIMVEGHVEQDQFTIISFLKKEEERVVVHANDDDGAKKAVSSFSVVRHYEDRTLLEARLLTGRTHQLRVQLAGHQHPIIGDIKYGRHRGNKMLLFSHRVVIAAFDLDVALPLPDYFQV